MAAPIPTARQKLVERAERMLLFEQLKRFKEIADDGKSERIAIIRKGAKLFKSKMWQDGITAGRLAITANQAVAVCERFLATIARARPTFEIEAIRGNDDDGARLLEGALMTNYRNNRMSQKVKTGGRQAMFGLPPFWYVYWDSDARGGKGDCATRVIPPHLCIIDDKALHVNEMQFAGFQDTVNRAELIKLYPDHADAIERSLSSKLTSNSPGAPVDPYTDRIPGKRGESISRLVKAENQSAFAPTASVTVGGTVQTKGLSDDVDVLYMWFQDPTPKPVTRVKRDHNGQPVMKAVRHPETGEYQLEHQGFKVVHGIRGPRYLPQLKLKRDVQTYTSIERLYPRWRHVAWIADENEPIPLWDANWDGPIPLVTERTCYPLHEYWEEGQALRLSSLAVARNILYTIIFQRLKLSLSGTFLATPGSGLKRNKLTPDDGTVFYARKIDQDNIKQFPVAPVDAAYFQLLNLIESEMLKLIGMSEPMRGNATGRADSGAVYENLIEQGGAVVVDAAQLLEQAHEDWAQINAWFMARYYTHEHFVEFEAEDGTTSWKQAHAIALQGEFAIRVEPGSMFAHSQRAAFEDAKEAAAMGFYPLPLLGKIGHVRAWRQGLKQREAIQQDPSKAWMLGPAGAPPGKAGTLPNTQKRNHHGTNGKS